MMMSKWEKWLILAVLCIIFLAIFYVYNYAAIYTRYSSAGKSAIHWNEQMQLVTIDLAHHDVLRHPAAAVSFPLDGNIKKLLGEMQIFFNHLESPYGKPAGLAATQIGIPLRIIVIQVPPEAKELRKDVYDTLPPTFLINPSYVAMIEEGKSKDWEGCYSVPERMGEVYRYNAIQFEAYAPNGEKISGIARGFLARLIQHEVGHLNGELYTDLLTSESRFGPVAEMMKIRKEERKSA